MSVLVTLLPPNAEPLEQAYAASGARHLTLEFPIEAMWDPWRCPAQYLPWLAWAMSVDQWDDTWSESTKRRAIAQAPEQHRVKGTVRCVRLALRLLGCRATITEWWQTNPSGTRGTFHVRAYANERVSADSPMLSARLIEQVRSAIMAAKPKSRAFTFDVGVAVAGQLSVAAAAQALQVGLFGGTASTPRFGRSHLSATVGAQAMQVGTFAGEATTPRHGRSTVSVAAAAQAIQIGSFEANAKHRSMR